VRCMLADRRSSGVCDRGLDLGVGLGKAEIRYSVVADQARVPRPGQDPWTRHSRINRASNRQLRIPHRMLMEGGHIHLDELFVIRQHQTRSRIWEMWIKSGRSCSGGAARSLTSIFYTARTHEIPFSEKHNHVEQSAWPSAWQTLRDLMIAYLRCVRNPGSKSATMPRYRSESNAPSDELEMIISPNSDVLTRDTILIAGLPKTFDQPEQSSL
jgi:hypothetical protein